MKHRAGLSDYARVLDDEVRWWLLDRITYFFGQERRRWLPLRPRSYFICATPRSGSGLLGHMLWQTGWAGQPQEYFKDWTPPRTDAAVSKIKQEATTWNGVLGIKVMADQLGIAVEQLRTLSSEYKDLAPHQVLGRVFPDAHYVWITRKDKIRQAVSWAKAEQTGQWFYVSPQAPHAETDPGGAAGPAASAGPNLTYDFQLLSHYHREILAQERLWEAFFLQAQVEPYRVVYEELVGNLESMTRDILKYVQVPLHRKAQFYDLYQRQPQREAIDLEWASRFREELGRQPGS